jgi:hypothetical protein
MIPSSLIVLDEIPLAPSGKVDRLEVGRLARSLGPNSMREVSEQPPGRTKTEEQIARIWEEVLGVRRVSSDEDFFNVGGHSLLGLQIAYRIAKSFNIDIKLGDILENSTIPVLARFVERSMMNSPSKDTPISSAAEDSGSSLPLSIQQKQSLAYEAFRRTRDPQNQIWFGLRIRGYLDANLLEKCVNQLISRHEILRTSYTPVIRMGSIRIQRWNQVRKLSAQQKHDATISFEQSIQRHSVSSVRLDDFEPRSGEVSETMVQRVIREIVPEDFDLSTCPLIHSRLLRFARSDHALIITVPHIASDGWSMNLFAKELLTLYASGSGASRGRLPRLQATYADFARYQKTQLAQAAQQVTNRRNEPGGGRKCLDVSSLLFGRQRLGRIFGQSHRQEASEILILDGERHISLRAATRNMRITVGMFMFGCFGAYLHLASGLSNFALWIMQANRASPEFENVMGFMAGSQVLSVRCSPGSTIESLMKDARNEFSSAAEKNVGLERGVTETVNREIAFEYRKNILPRDIAGLRIERFETPRNREGLGFAMKLLVEDNDASLIRISLVYCTDCFESADIIKVLHDLEVIMYAVHESHEARIGDLASRMTGLASPRG